MRLWQCFAPMLPARSAILLRLHCVSMVILLLLKTIASMRRFPWKKVPIPFTSTPRMWLAISRILQSMSLWILFLPGSLWMIWSPVPQHVRIQSPLLVVSRIPRQQHSLSTVNRSRSIFMGTSTSLINCFRARIRSLSRLVTRLITLPSCLLTSSSIQSLLSFHRSNRNPALLTSRSISLLHCNSISRFHRHR